LTRFLAVFIVSLLLVACSQKVPEDKFVGIWEIKGRKMFEGIQINIEKKNDILVGKIYRLNKNKFVKMFCDSNAVWISAIQRSSDNEFALTENKIGSELFSLNNLSTSQEFKVQFIDNNTFGLATDNSDPIKSTKIYKRVIK
jgi:hypothetical protein